MERIKLNEALYIQWQAVARGSMLCGKPAVDCCCQQTSRRPAKEPGLRKHIHPASQDGLDRHAHLVYTRHARCRMGCRHITEAAVQEILEYGEVNQEKSDPEDKPCPSFALEGYTHGGQHLRIVFAPCDRDTRVVICIDLDTAWSCACD